MGTTHLSNIEDGKYVKEQMRIINQGAAETLIIEDTGGNIQLVGPITLGYGGIVELTWNGSKWLDLSTDTGGASVAGELHVQDLSFTTSDPVEDTFPLTLTAPNGFTVYGIKVLQPINNTNGDLFYDAVQITSFSIAANVVTIDYITGLDPLISYTLRLELTSA